MSSNIPAQGTVFTEPSIKAATIMFKKVALDEKLGDLAVQGYEDRLNLGMMIDSEGWLAHFMMRSDELSVSLCDRRMWDATYLVDDKCFAYLRPVPMDYAEKQGLDINLYKEHSSAEDMIDPRLRYMIIRQALFNSIEVKENVVSLKQPNEALYASYIKKPLENGEIMPFLSKEHIKMNALIDYGNKLKSAYNKIMNRHQTITPGVDQ